MHSPFQKTAQQPNERNLSSGSVYLSTNSGATWATTSLPSTMWNSPCSSTNGSRLAAAAGYSTIYGGYRRIYTSTDSGVTWTQTAAPRQNWTSIACSADGSKLAAMANGTGIYTWKASPRLSVLLSQDSAVVSWPCLISTGGFRLQQNLSLSPSNWTDVPDPVVVTNDLNQVTCPRSAPRFYRLIRGQ